MVSNNNPMSPRLTAGSAGSDAEEGRNPRGGGGGQGGGEESRSLLSGHRPSPRPTAEAPHASAQGMRSIVVPGVMYVCTSSALILLNKHALSSFGFRCPNSMLFFHCVLAVVLVKLAELSGLVVVEPLRWKIVKIWFPVNLLFVGKPAHGMHSHRRTEWHMRPASRVWVYHSFMVDTTIDHVERRVLEQHAHAFDLHPCTHADQARISAALSPAACR